MDKTTMIFGSMFLVVVGVSTVFNPPTEEEIQVREQTSEWFRTEDIRKVENSIAKKRWATAVEVYALEEGEVSNTAIGIQKGQPVYDGGSGAALTPGSVVRDFRGVTAIIDEDGNASQIAIYYDLEKLGITNLEETIKPGVNQ